MKTKSPRERDRIDWHPAFIEAIQMELDDYSRELQFISEYQLTTEPLRIDVVIIKKNSDTPIKKNIAAIFRKENIVEYKSPNDYVSIDDFYKVYGYACLYASINKVPITHLTVSFIESRYPRKLLAHLQEARKFTVEETSPGIYNISGDIVPIQIIDSRNLSAQENLWLKSLGNKHDASTFTRIDDEINRKGKTARLQAYLDTIMVANYAVAEEATRMNKAYKRLEQLFVETGLAAKLEAKGEAKGEARARATERAEVARKALAQGLEPEFVQKITGLDIQTITSLK
jgi:hypothetical protein